MTSSRTVGPFCPIYREAVEAMAWRNASSAHAELLFDKFADAWWHDCECSFAFDKGNGSKNDRDKAEHEKEGHWLKSQFPGRYTAPASLLEEACARQRALVETLGGRVICLKNTERFVTGMGREHPLENGFLWHHTLGVPYLPGSSVKGMVRAWLREENGQIVADHRGRDCWQEPVWLREQFGTQGRAGRVVLLDMLPTQPPQLDVDVMTPHCGPYYQKKKGNDIPGDWHGPVPITFPTVSAGCSWQIGIIAADGERWLDDIHFDDLTSALLEAIEINGAGAKTAVGYGRCVRDTKREQQLADEQPRRREKERRAVEATEEKARREAEIAQLPEDVRTIVQMARDQRWFESRNPTPFLDGIEAFPRDNPTPSPRVVRWLKEHIFESGKPAFRKLERALERSRKAKQEGQA